VIVHGGQRALRDEDRELGILVGRAVDRLPEDGRRDRHQPVVMAGFGGLRIGSGLDELRPPGTRNRATLPCTPVFTRFHMGYRRPRAPILKYRASVTASTDPM